MFIIKITMCIMYFKSFCVYYRKTYLILPIRNLISTMTYNDQHKQLLQYFMQERMVSETQAKKVNSVLFPGKNIDNIIQLINCKIIPFDLKINKVACEQNGDIFYVFISIFVDDLNAKYDSNKAIFIKLVDYIITAGGSAPLDKVLTINSQMSEKVLDTFFSNKYCIADQADNILLTALAINELEGYLVDKFNEKRCMCCMNIVIYGVHCQSCGKFAHGYCLTKYCKEIGSIKCLKCSKNNIEWGSVEIPRL